MGLLGALKTPMLALTLAVAYSEMVLCIIQIIKVHEGQNGSYPPAVVAMLVLSILQMLYLLYVIARSGRGAINKASTVAAAFAFFLLFNLGAIIAVTVLRHHDDYCPQSASNFSDCDGVMRGTMGLGWALVGLDLLYLGHLAALVATSHPGGWGSELHDLPPRAVRNPDEEKAPTH